MKDDRRTQYDHNTQTYRLTRSKRSWKNQ